MAGRGWRREARAEFLMFRFQLLVVVLGLSGCCGLSKRSCFPACPPRARESVEVEKACQMPPRVVLEPVRRSVCPGRPHWACFEPMEAGRLAANLSILKSWISEVQERCGPANLPAALPAR